LPPLFYGSQSPPQAATLPTHPLLLLLLLLLLQLHAACCMLHAAAASKGSGTARRATEKRWPSFPDRFHLCTARHHIRN